MRRVNRPMFIALSASLAAPGLAPVPAPSARAEIVDLQTIYPPQFASYNRLMTTGGGGAYPVHTYLNTQGGSVIVRPDAAGDPGASPPNGSALPQPKLQVYRDLWVNHLSGGGQQLHLLMAPRSADFRAGGWQWTNGGTGNGFGFASNNSLDYALIVRDGAWEGGSRAWFPKVDLGINRSDRATRLVISAEGSNDPNIDPLLMLSSTPDADGDLLTLRPDPANASRPCLGIGTPADCSNTLRVQGRAAKNGGGSWLAFSDARLKDVLGPFTRGMAELRGLEPVQFRYKKNLEGRPSGETFVGLIAQDVRPRIPEAVKEDAQGRLLLNAEPVLWTMLNAIKEQQAEIETLEAELERLASRRLELAERRAAQ